MNNLSILLEDFKKVFQEGVTNSHKYPQITIKRKRFKQVRNYLRQYAEKNGMYFVELDEFTDTYIGRATRLYQDMADNDFAIIYLRMYDCIDYEQPHHQHALSTLFNILSSDCNLQFVIDYHITSKDTEEVQIPRPILDKCYVWEVK